MSTIKPVDLSITSVQLRHRNRAFSLPLSLCFLQGLQRFCLERHASVFSLVALTIIARNIFNAVVIDEFKRGFFLEA